MKQQVIQRMDNKQQRQKQNRTGIAVQAIRTVEERSGQFLGGVSIHLNSDKPAQFHALAMAQGENVYVGPAQEKHIPHELGHVLQQRAGLVRPTAWVNSVPVNDDPRLERAADEIGKGYFAQRIAESAQRKGGENIIQLYSDDEVASLLERCIERGWTEITLETCAELLKELDEGSTPRIGNHHAVLTKRNIQGKRRIYIMKHYFPGDGPLGRLAPSGGATCTITPSSDEGDYDDITDVCTLTGGSSAPKVGDRLQLAKIMGGSASKKSTIMNAEYLHHIAHQLGGKDVASNLTIGLHGLNTAMIPFENLVKELSGRGLNVAYFVTMLPRPGIEMWSSDVMIEIDVGLNDWWHGKKWTLSVDTAEFLSKGSYTSILAVVEEFRKEIEAKLKT